MGNVFFFDWEIQFMAWLQSFESGFATAAATFFTMLGEEYLMILILGLVYWSINKELGRRVALAITGTMIFGGVFKCLVTRRRPYMDNEAIKCIRAAHPDDDLYSVTAQGYSMPSLHASMSAATYGSLARETKKKPLVIFAFLLPLFIGLSRNYLGVHYPTDVLAGWAFGAAAVFVLGTIEHKKGYKPVFLFVLAIGLVGLFFFKDNEFYSSFGTTAGVFAGFLFEERYVNFNKTEKVLSMILRPVIGVIIFVFVSSLLKLPVSSMSEAENALFLLIYRLFRYTVSTFVIIGIYPLLFEKVKILK